METALPFAIIPFTHGECPVFCKTTCVLPGNICGVYWESLICAPKPNLLPMVMELWHSGAAATN